MIFRLLFFVVLSSALHLYAVGFLPPFDIEFKPRTRTVEVEIIPAAIRELPPAPIQKAGSSAVNRNADRNEATPPALTIPEVDIPDITGADQLDIKIPELNVSRLESTSRLRPDKELLKELKSSSDDFRKANRAGEGVTSDIVSSETSSRDFFVIKNLNRNRALTNVPEKPVFSLTTDTTVRVGFKVDREGNTFAIILQNSTDSKIERLAIDFVKKLKFNAVLAEEPESAEIILNFRVR